MGGSCSTCHLLQNYPLLLHERNHKNVLQINTQNRKFKQQTEDVIQPCQKYRINSHQLTMPLKNITHVNNNKHIINAGKIREFTTNKFNLKRHTDRQTGVV